MINQSFRPRNLVAECYFAAERRNRNLSWEQMDKMTEGMVSSFTYLVLFINDQIYAADMEINEVLPNDPELYRGSARKTYARLHKSIDNFVTVNNSYLGKEGSYATADVLASVEDDMKPHINNLYYAVSQSLLEAGVEGNRNIVASKVAILNMLCQLSRILILEFDRRLRSRFGEGRNPLEVLSQDKHEYLSFNLMEDLVPKSVKVNLSKDDRIDRAFDVFNNKLLHGDFFNKALDNCPYLEKEGGDDEPRS